MLRWFLVIILVLVNVELRSQQQNEIENSLITSIYHFDFKAFRNQNEKVKLQGNNLGYQFLYKFLYNQGYYKESDSILATKIASSQNIIDQIAISKYYLYNERRSDTTYFLLFNSYRKIKERNLGKEITKLSLLSFLEYYARETILTEDAFLRYLKEFEKLCESIEDFAWLYFYKDLFEGRSVNSSKERYYKSGILCKNFYEKNKSFLNNAQRASLLENLVNHERLENNEQGLIKYISRLDNMENVTYTKLNRFNAYLDGGAYYADKKDYQKSDEFFRKAYALINKSDPILGIISFNKFKSFYYHVPRKEFKKAYFLLNESYNLSRVLSYQENSAKTSVTEVRLNTAEKEKQILLEQQRVKEEQLRVEEQTQKARSNRNWLIAAGIALLLGTGIAVLLQKNTTKKRLLAEQEALLKQQRVENLLKEQELVSIDAMIAGQEKERQKVAGELHDDLGSLMATIKLHFDHAKISKQDLALRHAQKLLEEAYQKVRGMAHSKNSGVMSDQGLLSALKKMAKTIRETNAMEVTVEDFGLGERMENSLELSIFRMIQELVANAIKHAEASRVNIQLTQHEENLNIIVEDNGKGFDLTNLNEEKSGMGLTNIEKRVEHLEGSFTIDSVLGNGTSILIDIPV